MLVIAFEMIFLKYIFFLRSALTFTFLPDVFDF